jgi:hypothetical protein
MSIVNFSFGIVLMLLDSDRRLYQGHSVVLVLVRMMMPFSWTPLVVVFLSIRLAAVEERWHKVVLELCSE